jgi:lactate dehydrogenase-like 2-hydroxyacid dehydrogenase
VITVPCVDVAADEREQLMSAFRDHPLEALLLSGSLAEHLSMLRDTRVLIVTAASAVDAATIGRMPRLRMLATRSASAGHIDLDACRARGIVVATGGTAAAAVAAVADWAAGRKPADRVA